MTRRSPQSIVLAIVIASAALVAAQAPPAQAPLTGHALLVGQVVEAGTTTPVSGALVTLGGTASIISSNVIFEFAQGAIPGGNRATLTDAQGHFVFANLPAGTYSLQATKAGFSPGGYGKRRATGAPQPIVVTDGDRIGDLSIPLSKFATVGGTITDEAGEPIIGVQVKAMRRVYEKGRLQYTTALNGMTGETDDRGVYRLATLIPGEYLIGITATQTTAPMATVDAYRQAAINGTSIDLMREIASSNGPDLDIAMSVPIGNLSFQAAQFGSRAVTPPSPLPDGRLFVYPTQFYPSALSPLQATVIALRAGEDRAGVDWQVRPVATIRISGAVTGPSGPMANMGLTLVPATTNLVTDRFFVTANTLSDANGAFVFLGVPAGQYVLQAVKVPPRPLAPNPLTTVVQTGSGTMFTSPNPGVVPPRGIPQGPTLWANQPVTVERTDVSGVTVTLQSGFHVSGHFEFEGSGARPAPAALSRLLVIFEALDDRAASALAIEQASIDTAAGRITSYELPPGKYHVRVQGTIPGWTFKSAMVNGRDVSDVPLDLSSEIADVAMTWTDRPSTLRGTVRASTGNADATAQVMVCPIEAASPEFAGAPRRLRAARTGRTGAYEIAGLPAGEYYVVAAADEFAGDFPSPTLLRALSRLATRVQIKDGESTTQDLSTVTIR